MCGVIGFVSERDRADLGQVATALLRMLEYRGYDSTGAVIQAGDGEPILRKGVGAPSKVTGPLGIPELSGRLLCGQVRWATFGSVDAVNAQPHEVACHTALYGAHNGNVNNSDDLQRWLRAEGHAVASDNDGEMVVHTIEHFFAAALAERHPDVRGQAEVRRALMREAIVRANKRFRGSFSAVVVDPITRVAWAIKAGSSLYFGVGVDPEGGRFGVASSDLSSVLTQTHRLVPIQREDVVEFDGAGHGVFRLADGAPVERGSYRSRLRSQDITLQPPFETFMEQEISAQDRTVGKVVETLGGGSPRLRRLAPAFRAISHAAREDVEAALHTLRGQTSDEGLSHALAALLALPAFERVSKIAPPVSGDGPLCSSEAGLLADLGGAAAPATLALVDAWIEHAEVEQFNAAADRFAELCATSQARGGRTYVLCCGTSHHAAKAAALFFNEIAHVQLLPMLPGDFRGQCSRSLQDGDLLVAVSQSGETKDLVDAMSAALASGRDLATVALVNNVNSTLAQELASLVIPLHCGPEIAVPATKSFMNQLAVFYGLAVRLAERQLAAAGPGADPALAAAVAYRRESLARLPQLVRDTFDTTDGALDEAAELLYLEPSIHILATRMSAVAKEGALKIREVVLNHTEGFEGSEFKHGPNTILGVNTLYGPRELQRLLQAWSALPSPPSPEALFAAGGAGVDDELRRALFDTVTTDYPLIYVTGPDARDVQLTVSQIHTHKIRGATTVLIAEEDADLRQAATKAPTFNVDGYRSVYVVLPPTGDSMLTVFSATVALQRLALKMSVKKAAYLDGLGIREHGVHPDVPKNVSKSITVD